MKCKWAGCLVLFVLLAIPATAQTPFITGDTITADRLNAALGWKETSTTLTGNQDNFNFLSAGVLRGNNATTLTLRGLVAGEPGKRLIIVSVGAGQVDLANQDINSTAANRIITGITGTISLAAGSGRAIVEYDGTTARWRLVAHEQGAAISYTPTWTGSVTNPAIGNGTLAGQYYLRGRRCWVDIRIVMGSTTTFGSGRWSNALPLTAVATTGPALLGPIFNAALFDTGTAYRIGLAFTQTTTTVRSIFDSATDTTGDTVPITWASGDEFRISGEFLVE